MSDEKPEFISASEMKTLLDAKKAHVDSAVVLWNTRLTLLLRAGKLAEAAEHLTTPVEQMRPVAFFDDCNCNRPSCSG